MGKKKSRFRDKDLLDERGLGDGPVNEPQKRKDYLRERNLISFKGENTGRQNQKFEDDYNSYLKREPVSNKEKEAKEKTAYNARIRLLRKDKELTDGKPVKGQIRILDDKITVGGSKNVTYAVPGIRRPETQRVDGGNRMRDRQGKGHRTVVPHPREYTIVDNSSEMTVTFHGFFSEVVTFTTLPKPHQSRLDRHGGGQDDNDVVYTWDLGRIKRNKLVHALKGNTPYVWHVPRKEANKLQHSLNGNTPEAEPKKAVCNTCGKEGHFKRNCPKAGAKGGGRGGDKMLKRGMADMEAQRKAENDNAKEKRGDQKKEKEAVKCRFFNDNLEPIRFKVEVKEPVTPMSWIRLGFLFRIAPLMMGFFFFDLGLWPHISNLAATLAEHVVHVILFLPVFVGMMMLENIFVGLVAYRAKAVFTFFLGKLTVRHSIALYPVPDHREFSVEEDKRPLDCTFGPRAYVAGICRYTVTECFYVSFPYWQIHMALGSRRLAVRECSSTAIALYGSVINSNLTVEEYRDAIRRNLSKCSKIDWDAEEMIRGNILENTCSYLEYLKLKVDQGDFDKSLENRSYEDVDLFDAPWFHTKAGRIFSVLFVLGLVYFGGGTLASIVMALFRVVAAVWTAISAFMVQCNEFAGSIASLRPLGVYGYSVSDPIFQNVSINEVDPEKFLSFTSIFPALNKTRAVMATFSPFAIPGIALPMTDRGDMLTTAAGLIHRGAALTPKVDKIWNRAKREIVDQIVDRFFLPLSDSDLIGFDEMIDNTNYTLDRKKQIKTWHKNRKSDFARPTKHKETGMFNKEEPYSVLKQARSIQGMYRSLLESDVWGSVGRLVHTVQKTVYSLPPSIKKLDPQGIVDKLLSLGPGSKTVSDYSSYEASFKETVKEAAQFRLYDRLTENLSGYAKQVRGQARWVLGREVSVRNKFFNASIKNIKCSGDFDTSLSNWFDNVATWLTVFEMKHGVHWTDAINWILCEGDDNITDDHGYTFEKEDFAKLGMTAKIESGLELSEAGFCQKYVNVSTGTLIGDVITFLGKRQYLPARYQNSSQVTKLSLSKATAMSVLSMFKNAPGISEWAYKVLELTSGITVRAKHLVAEVDKHAHSGTGVKLSTLFTKPVILDSDRIMVSRVFGFTLEQQAILTTALDAWTGGPLQLPLSWFPDLWRDFYGGYNTLLVGPSHEFFNETNTISELRRKFPELLE
ncbi:hypothetical protein 2 [Beihai tombus-like virus 17]|uniref:hypothetical protein 2 n=1 Tax=Beihai tombus-like virus 17 TaxID=1922720 RepID=UPI0009095A75|nr:hypothetical protein 2 [Beihai tombus-like virus 17]APG76183.1 hypothetical protein 2 [Beihai tombus-like virus 17]